MESWKQKREREGHGHSIPFHKHSQNDLTSFHMALPPKILTISQQYHRLVTSLWHIDFWENFKFKCSSPNGMGGVQTSVNSRIAGNPVWSSTPHLFFKWRDHGKPLVKEGGNRVQVWTTHEMEVPGSFWLLFQKWWRAEVAQAEEESHVYEGLENLGWRIKYWLGIWGTCKKYLCYN